MGYVTPYLVQAIELALEMIRKTRVCWHEIHLRRGEQERVLWMDSENGYF